MSVVLPPQSLIALISPDNPTTFRANGAEMAMWLREYCNLTPSGMVLDVGCGVGRVALPLTRYLSPAGGYRGFDLIRPCVEWCSGEISKAYPNFQFQHADLHSKLYNPAGAFQPAEFKFSYADSTFDVVLLASVFTHMLPDAVENYVKEIRRVLKPGGHVLATFFLMDHDSRALMAAGRSRHSFGEQIAGCYYVSDPANPEAAVVFDARFVTDLWSLNGFVLKGTYPGKWSGRLNSYSGQDIVIAKKR